MLPLPSPESTTVNWRDQPPVGYSAMMLDVRDVQHLGDGTLVRIDLANLAMLNV